jgi:hypothetical protein
MKRETFEDTLRGFLRRDPFQPFIIQLESGEDILIEEPTVAFSDGFAGYFSPAYDIIEFTCEQVREMRLAARESAP